MYSALLQAKANFIILILERELFLAVGEKID
jgi:hypothetical protein